MLNADTGTTIRTVCMSQLHALLTTTSYVPRHSSYQYGVSTIPARYVLSGHCLFAVLGQTYYQKPLLVDNGWAVVHPKIYRVPCCYEKCPGVSYTSQ